MGALQKILFSAIVLAIAFSYQAYRDMSKPFPKPDLDLKEYWGRGDVRKYKEDKAIKPFTISYSAEVIKRLTDRINDAQTFTDPLEDTAFEYGFNSKRLKEVVNYWKGQYLPKWSERETFLNQFPQFTTQVQGLNIHYIHVKPKTNANTKVYPLILLHGWPGSVREFYEIIPLLTNPSKDNIAFEVIAPSLPGYGFSEGASKQGLGPLKTAVVMRNLMLRIGFDKFYVQGGDWGSIIGADMATMFPENVSAYHSNMCNAMAPFSAVKMAVASFFPSWFIEDEEVASWVYPFTPKFFDILQESGYMHIQATKPDTIGVVLQNNPVGLAAYIIEKFSTWTNKDYRNLADGGLEKYFTLDSLLDNIMIYYLTNSITTSVRIYKENFIEDSIYNIARVPALPPTGCARFKNELAHSPDFVLKDKFKNIIHTSKFSEGGHFAAMQLPKVLYNDFLEFVRKTLVKSQV